MIHVSGPDEVNDVSDLKVVTTVTNTGDESMKLLNDPSGVLNAFPTEAFAIQHSDSGSSPDFIGVRVRVFLVYSDYQPS
jgi:peptidyl-Lys metalloendopeptidase